MAKHRKDTLREIIWELRAKHPEWTLKRIAEEVGFPDRQWIWYYLKTKLKDAENKETAA